MSSSPGGLADEALDNLVNQFARPLDCLRELVQNAIDAGTSRVEVWVAWFDQPGPTGVLEIGVDDFGEGMDEHIIDTQLTRMFSSTKEDDLSKIGKFGIGFTSIFAIRPDAVRLRTSRHGERWELVFHADRTYEKRPHAEPVDGTRITLFKRLPDEEKERWLREIRWTLDYWCEHSDAVVTFEDRTARTEAPRTANLDAADPFASFASPAPSRAERVTGPLSLDAELTLRRVEGEVEVLVGLGDRRFGFYNGGLTLVSTRSPEALGSWADTLGHLCFKVKYDRLEHTLTRDNVIQDAQWRHAMQVVWRASLELQERVLERLETAVRTGEPIERWVRATTEAVVRTELHKRLEGFAGRVWLPDHRGEPVSLAQLEAQEAKLGPLLLAGGSAALHTALQGDGLLLVQDSPAIRALLVACYQRPRLSFFDPGRRLRTASEVFVLPGVFEPADLPAEERPLCAVAASLLETCTRGRARLAVGDFGGPGEVSLAVEGPADGGLFQRPGETWFRIPAFLRRRTLLLNRHHPTYRTQLVAAGEDVELAALALVQAMLFEEDLEGERTHERLWEAQQARTAVVRA